MEFNESLTAAISASFERSIAYDTYFKRSVWGTLDLRVVIYFPEKERVEVWLPQCETLADKVRAIWLATPPTAAHHGALIDSLGRVTIALTAVDDG